MRAFVVTGPGTAEVDEVPDPVPGPGDVVVEVERVGVCGTDVEFFTGEMSYLHTGDAHYPIRLGHEWAGTVSNVGAEVDPSWMGVKVMGDTILGDDSCRQCRRGQPQVCLHRREVGVRAHDGALADRVVVPWRSLHRLPEGVDVELGALVEPGGNALRAANAARENDPERVLVIGPGTIGLLTALFLQAEGVEVHVLGVTESSLAFARELGLEHSWTSSGLPDLPFDTVVDASNDGGSPAFALERVEPAGRLVYIGLAGEPSLIDTRQLALKDVTAVGILSASPALDDTIAAYASGLIDPRPLVAATVPLERVADVLGGWRPVDAGPGPKVHVDPRLFDGP